MSLWFEGEGLHLLFKKTAEGFTLRGKTFDVSTIQDLIALLKADNGENILPVPLQQYITPAGDCMDMSEA